MRPREEYVLVLVKPDGVRRGYTEKIIEVFTLGRLILDAQKTIKPTQGEIARLLPPDDESVLRVGTRMVRGKKKGELIKAFGTSNAREIAMIIRNQNIDYLSDIMVVLLFSGQNATKRSKIFKKELRKMWCEEMARDEVYLSGKTWRNILHTTNSREFDRHERWAESIPEYKEGHSEPEEVAA